MHLKRNEAPKTWAIPRKGTKFLAVPKHAKKNGLPLLFIFRDLLKVARTRKEVKKILQNGDVQVNQKVRRDEMYSVQVFDVVTVEKTNKNYKMEIVKGKFALKEIDSKEAGEKIVKIIGKKFVKKGKVQANLEDGQNFIYDKEFGLGDSAVINFEDKKISKILPLKKGAKVEIISGKHAGEIGELKDIEKLDKITRYKIKLGDSEVKVPLKTFIVIG